MSEGAAGEGTAGEGAAWRELPLGEHVLAESPRWDARTGELVWVDVVAGTLGRASYDARTGAWRAAARQPVTSPLTSVAPLHDPAMGWVVATGAGLATVSRSGKVSPLCRLVGAGDYPAVRTNDMVADSSGRLLVGLLAESRSEPRAALLRVDPDGATTVAVPDLIAANGLGLSPNESALYLVDSVPRTLTAHPYDAAPGSVGPGEILVRWAGPGTFDGLAVDGEGGIWVAVWDAGVVCRYSGDGDLLGTYPAPARVARPTALAFAGPDLATLVLTTARLDLSTPCGALSPQVEGRLYAMNACVRGLDGLGSLS